MFQRARLLTTLVIFTGFLTSLPISKANAVEEPGAFRFAVLGGLTGLLGEVGEGRRTATALGGSIGYRINQPFAVKVHYLASAHSNVSHRDFSIGTDYYFNDEIRKALPWEISKFFPFATAGLSFVSNHLRDIDVTGNSVALFAGAGFDYHVGKRFRIGPQAIYQKAVEAQSALQGAEIKTVQDSYLVLLRVSYSYFGEE